VRFPIEIDAAMELSAIRRTHLVYLTIILMVRAGYAPLTLTPIWLGIEKPRLYLRISYEYLPDVIEDLNTLYLLESMHQEELYGDGSNTGA
jgi:hypothetical protein